MCVPNVAALKEEGLGGRRKLVVRYFSRRVQGGVAHCPQELPFGEHPTECGGIGGVGSPPFPKVLLKLV